MKETTAARTEATLAQCAEQNGDLFAFAELLPETALATALGTGGPPVEVEITGRSLADLRLGAEAVRDALGREKQFAGLQDRPLDVVTALLPALVGTP